ncbi:MAG: hypothetical protein AB8B99_02955 [Phormidesmis sp.]
MNKAAVGAASVGIGLLVAAVTTFRYNTFTDWTDERIDPHTMKAVCRETTYIEVFGKLSVKDGPPLPNSECRGATNFWLTEPVNDGCTVEKDGLTAKCSEAYQHPIY